MAVSPRLIQEEAEEHYGIELDPARARELAEEVERLNAAARRVVAPILDFNDEPSRFLAVLSELGRKEE